MSEQAQGSIDAINEPAQTALDRRPRVLKAFFKNPLGVISAVILLVMITAAVLAPWLAPTDPAVADLPRAFEGPAPGHPLGFDSAGRDVLTRVLYGAQNTFTGAGLALVVALVLGVPSGLIAGYYGRVFDATANWIVNLIMSLPAMVVLLASRAILGPTVWVLMIIMGVLVAPSFFRLTRGIVANIRNELYVDAARVSGLPDWRIIGRHVLIVVRAPIIIQIALVAGVAIGLQAGLEFLGISSGDLPTWGAMLNEGFQNIQRAPVLMLWPGLALGLASGAMVLFAAAVRDLLEDRGAEPVGRQAKRMPVEAPQISADASGRGQLLSVRGLKIAYTMPGGRDSEIVHGIDLDIQPGQVLGLVGESGSGKTQTAFAILGLIPEGGRISAGSITIEGREVRGVSRKQRRALRGDTVAYVPQEPMSNLDPSFTIGSQLIAPIRHKLGLSRSQARTKAIDLLRTVEINDPDRIMKAYPHEISGGMAQRVLIAGALSCNPKLVIADEPTTALDVTVQADVLNLLRKVQTERGPGVLLVTHNLGVVADLCDDVAVMQEGRIVEAGSVGELFADPTHPYTQKLLGAVLDGHQTREPWNEPVEAHATIGQVSGEK